ncbi:hypothetical protein E2320_011960 [Naja naja]|nr:hypothetical protein E2320_011960 [Naja naja]
MDFVILFGLYLGLVLLSVVVCVSSRREQSFSWRLIRGTSILLCHSSSSSKRSSEGNSGTLPFQQLFLTFPRIVFMLGFVILLLVILGSYFCFILYLVLTNQTSNEWFKSARYTLRTRAIQQTGRL